MEIAVPSCLWGPDPPWQPALRSISQLLGGGGGGNGVCGEGGLGGSRHLQTPPRCPTSVHISPKKKTHQHRDCLSASASHYPPLITCVTCVTSWVTGVSSRHIMREHRGKLPHMYFKKVQSSVIIGCLYLICLSQYPSETCAWFQTTNDPLTSSSQKNKNMTYATSSLTDEALRHQMNANVALLDLWINNCFLVF